MREECFRRNSNIELAILTLFAVVLRLLFLAPYPTGWDDVDFALALEQYDMSRMRPHFPGYPVYILVAHLFYAWLHDPFLSLSVLSAVAGGLTVIPLWLLFHKMGSAPVARLTVWLYALAPLPLVTSIQPMSDSLGVLLAAWLAYFAWSAAERTEYVTGPLVAAGITLGLLLGVRVSYLALSVLWFWAIILVLRRSVLPMNRRIWSITVSVGTAAITCIIWLAALVISAGGVDSFLAVAVSFTGGHFSDWGGAYKADSSLAERTIVFFFRQIGAAGLGTIWPEAVGASGHAATFWEAGGWRWISTILAGLGVVGLALRQRIDGSSRSDFYHRLPIQTAIFLLIWIAPYLIWAFFAQNVEKPRHILPLLPPFLYLLVTGLQQAARLAAWKLNRTGGASDGQQLRQGVLQHRILTVMGIVWVAGMVGVSYPLLKEAHSAESPMMQLARYVKTNVPTDDSLIFTWEEERVLEYMSPTHTTIRLRKWEDFRMEILQYSKPPARILATNALVEGMDRPVEGLFREVQAFRGNPWLYPTYHTIVLYEGTSLLYDELRKG